MLRFFISAEPLRGGRDAEYAEENKSRCRANTGPGLLETAYQWCLEIEFKEKGWAYQQEQAVPLVYKNRKLDCGFRLDFLIEDKVILELTSVEKLLPIHEAQLLTYLRLLNKQVGLLINFNEPVLKRGIRRCVLGAKDSLSSSGQGPA